MSPPASLILCHANVITLDRARPAAGAVAVSGSRIAAVGADTDILPLRGAATEVIDCEGQTVVPGFHDAHCHPIALAAAYLAVDCGPASVRSIAEIREAIGRRASRTPPGRWIRATGYNEFYLAEKRHPTSRDLDAVSPQHPVKLVHRSGHACVLNSRAMELLGISAETEEPEGGMMERDLDTGQPNGLLFEMNTIIDQAVPPLTDDELETGIGLANRDLLAAGITSLQDASWNNSQGRWRLLRRLKEQGKLIPRVSMMTGEDALAEREAFAREALAGQLVPGPVKIVLQTATGSLSPPQEDLDRLVLELHARGRQAAFHADEAATLEAALTALERALSRAPRGDHRHRIEHCSVCPPPLMERLRRTGAMVVTQPPFIYYSGERYLATVAAADLPWLYAMGSLRRRGIRVAASSDAPVVPFQPLVGMGAAVTRRAASGQELLPHEGITPLEALQAYTLDAAYAGFEDRDKGLIAPGKLADLAILGDDPAAVPPEQIKDIPVTATILGGQVVWRR